MDAPETPRWPLPAAALGVVLLTVAGIDALWQLVTNRDPEAAPDAASTGPWLDARLALGLVAAALILAAAWRLYATRDAAE
jgi:hypothetical protein